MSGAWQVETQLQSHCRCAIVFFMAKTNQEPGVVMSLFCHSASSESTSECSQGFARYPDLYKIAFGVFDPGQGYAQTNGRHDPVAKPDLNERFECREPRQERIILKQDATIEAWAFHFLSVCLDGAACRFSGGCKNVRVHDRGLAAAGVAEDQCELSSFLRQRWQPQKP